MLAVFGCGSSGPSAAIDSFVKASQAKDCEKIVNLLDYSEYEKQGAVINRDDEIQNCKEHPESIEDIVSYKIVEEKVDGDTAQVKVETTTRVNGQEQTETVQLNLKNNGGTWQLVIGQ